MINKHTQLFSIKNIFLAAICFSLFACGSEQTNDNSQNITDTTKADTVAKENTSQKIFYALPSPIQLGKMLQKSGANYDKKIMSSIDDVSKYATSNSKALNLGVYGADLSYSAIFGQSQETMNYLKSCKKLAEELNITGSFSTEMMKRMEANVSKKDSILPLISEVFLNSDEALKENSQSNISTLVLAGGFIEGLYVGTQVAKTVKNNKDVVTRIAELKGALNNLVLMLSTETADQEVVTLTNDLKAIKEVYNEMTTTTAEASVKADTTTNKMTIGGKSSYTLSKEQLDKITTKVAEIRTKITKP